MIIFIGRERALLWVVIRYRRSKQPAGYIPPQIHGNFRLEVGWTVIPLVVVLAIAAYSFNELQKDFQPISNYHFQGVVAGHQFAWNYTYPHAAGFTIHQERTPPPHVTTFVH